MVERRVIGLGGVVFEVRPMAGVLQSFEVWRGQVELGFFTVGDDGEIAITLMTPYQLDAVMMRLVSEEYVRPVRLRSR